MTPSLRLASAIVPVLLAASLMGCQKNEETAAGAHQAPAASQSTNESVARPANQVPPSDAAIPPSPPTAAQGTSSSGSANGPSQADPKELSKREETAAMPMPGQVNNHSTVPTTGGGQK